MAKAYGSVEILEPQEEITSRQSAILDLMKQGVIDSPTILNYLNYDNEGNKTGDFTLEEVEQLKPKANKITEDIISKVEGLSGLKFKDKNILYSAIELNKTKKGTPLGQQNKNVIVINSNIGDNPAGETTESSLIHEALHNLIYQSGLDKTLSKDEQEMMVKDAEYYYLAGGKGIAPSFKKLQTKPQEEVKKYGSVELLSNNKTYGSVELLSTPEPEPTKQYGSVELLSTPQPTYDYGTVELLSSIPEQNILPSQEDVMRAQAELRKPLQDITPSRGGILTKEIVEKWGAMQKEKPEVVNWKYLSTDVSEKKYKNVVSKLLFDVLQRGEFMVANAMDAVMTGDDNVIKAAIDGLTGKEKRDFYDIAVGLGYGKWGSLAIGMAAGVMLDPVNYVPFAEVYKSLSKTIGKTKAMDAIKSSSIAEFLRKGFTSGEGAPPALHELTKTLKKYKRYEETKIYEEIEDLSKLMKNKKNAELITNVRAGKLAIEDLTPEAAATLKRIDEGYANIAAEGVKAGLLKQEDLIENYQHGFYFTGDTALTKINSNIKNGHAGAPAFAHMRNVGNVVDYSNSRLDLIKKVDDAIANNNVAEARKLVENFPLAKGQTLVTDASTFTPNQLKRLANSVPRPNLNALENYAYRKLEHVSAMFRQKLINTVVDPSLPYATPISKMTSKTIRPGNAAYMVKYRIPDINLKEADEAGLALWKQIAKNADNDIVELSPKLTEDILNSPYMQKLFKGKGPRLFEMPTEIVDYLNEGNKLFTTKWETLDKILSEASRIQDMWKPMATVARPFWHIRNVTFNQMQLYLSGVSPFDLAPRAIEAFKSIRGKSGYLDTRNFGKVDLKKLGVAAKKNGLFGVGFAGGDLASQASAIRKVQRAANPAKITMMDITKAPKNILLKPAEFFEDNAHMVAFLDYVAKSHDSNLETAILNGAKHAFKYLYDYSDLSTFEKGPMKLLVPFYSWIRKTLGLYAGDMLEQPQKYANIGKLRKTLGKFNPETEQEKALKPDWMDEQGYMKSPFKVNGKETYFYLAMPPDDLQTLTSFKDMYATLTPYKAIVEVITGIKQFPELGTKIEGESPAPAYMTFFPEKTWKLLKLRPGRYTDYNSGITKDVLMIPNKYLYAIETAFPPLRNVHNWFPQAIELAQEKSTAKVYSEATGISLVNENINQWRNNIVFEIKELQAELIKNAKKYEGIHYKGQVYNYVNETAEGQELQRKIIELSKKLNVK
ncbi:MAG: hypothetical protein PHI16_01250 [Methanocellales archaeon]|nr:hypothetical protein [Methanocellales archaeon]